MHRSLLVGGFAMACLGFIIHDAFKWAGMSLLAGAFFPVNESVWEHLKMAYVALLLISFFEYPLLKTVAQNYFLSKSVGLIAFELSILGVHYAGVWFTGKSILWIDILSYFIGIVICQLICKLLWNAKSLTAWKDTWNSIPYILTGFLFILFTFAPPHLEIFKDSKTQTYGIFKSH